jgi:hypothetical protein
MKNASASRRAFRQGFMSEAKQSSLEPENCAEVRDSFQGALDAIETYFERNWTDGLPIVPPVPELIRRMLNAVDRKPHEVLGAVAPRMGEATVEAVAINAVMAGCKPEYFPVVLAAVEAVLEPSFNLGGVQATTNPLAPLVIVSDTLGVKLGFNSGYNCFGQGNRANATVGRALRLVLSNLGGGHPGTGDKSTMGQPAKYTFCVAESPLSPWPPLHVDQGLPKDSDGVTILACNYYPVEAYNRKGRMGREGQVAGAGLPSPERDDSDDNSDVEILESYAEAVIFYPGTQCANFGGQVGIVINPHLAQILAKQGWQRRDIQLYLYENARIPRGSLPTLTSEAKGLAKKRWPLWFNLADAHKPIPLVKKPEDYIILCCGDAYRVFGAVLGPWSSLGGAAHSKVVRRAEDVTRDPQES